MIVLITNTHRNYPTRVDLGSYGIETTGYVICEQARTIDLTARDYRVVEEVPEELINKVLQIVSALISKDDQFREDQLDVKKYTTI